MSKRDLKKYLHSLPKKQLEEQMLDLYSRFKPVKVYYDFVFNPDEVKLMEEAKFKIRKEYFPQGRRKPKARRSVAQKYFRHFVTLGVESNLIADLMLFNIETAQAYCLYKPVKQESFYISLFRSYREAFDFIRDHCSLRDFSPRLKKIAQEADEQNWFNKESFLEFNPLTQVIQ